MGILKLSDFCLSLVLIKDQGTIDDGITPLCIAAHKGHLVVPDAKKQNTGGWQKTRHFFAYVVVAVAVAVAVFF